MDSLGSRAIRIAAAIAIAIAGALPVAPLLDASPPDGYREERIATGTLLWRGWSEPDRRQVASMLPGALSEVEARLRRPAARPLTIVLVPDGFELARWVERAGSAPPPAELVLGVALPEAGTLVLRGGVAFGSESFSVTLVHELAHLVIHRQPGVHVPRWFDEGVATWLSGARPGAAEEAYLSFLARIGGLHPLPALDRGFPGGHLPTSVAYQQSLLFILCLVERQGEDALPRLLDAFEAGVAAPLALLRVTGSEPGAIEAEFKRWVAARRSLAAALGSVVNVWTISALLALGAIGRYLLRRRRWRRSETGEPAIEEPLAAGD